MKLSDQLYNVLKFVAQYLLPACGTLYFTLSKIWNLPYPEQVVGTILAADAFLGALLSISTMQYKAEQKELARINNVVKPQLNSYDDPMPPDPVLPPPDLGKFLPKNVYDALYWVAQVLLPAGGTLYFALSALWGWPYGEQILATIVALDTFLGFLLGLSSMQYKKALAKMA